MGKKKIKIEFEDAEGSKYNLSLDGDISKSKILKVYELMETLNVGGESNDNSDNGINHPSHSNIQSHDNLTSVGSKIWNIINSKFPKSTFTSSDIQEMYEEEYNESMPLSAVSTYLSRYSNKRKLVRNKKGGKEWVYKIATEAAGSIMRPSSIHKHDTQYMQTQNQRVEQGHSSIHSLPPPPPNNFSSLTDVN